MADSSLWPVVVGGLLTGLFTLGGIGVGFIGSARREATQQRHETKKRRADKFEELVAAVYEFDHWLERIRNRDALGIPDSAPPTASPFSKLQSISAVYFPQFVESIAALDIVSTKYRVWIHQAEGKRLANDPNQFEGLSEAHTPYVQQRENLLRDLREFARKEFQGE